MTTRFAIPDQQAHEMVREFSRLLDARVPPIRERSDETDWSILWNELEAAGWLDARGIEDDRVPLLDLAELTEVWGRHVVPLPFTATLVLRRWLKDGAVRGPLAIALPAREGNAIAPFGGLPGVRVISDFGQEGGGLQPAGAPDTFAPSSPLLLMNGPTVLSEMCLAEYVALSAAESVGGARLCLELALRYCSDRVAFGRPIGQFQAVQHLAADALRDAELAKSAVAWAANAESFDEATRAGRACVLLTRRSIESSMQIFGGISQTWELDLHWYLRHAMVLHTLYSIVDSKQPVTS